MNGKEYSENKKRKFHSNGISHSEQVESSKGFVKDFRKEIIF
ncbi:hypothetical protein LEP1GSC052_0308 [Leptospira kmetyi serovar Malaysia str. Bejo-Iso9]|nr:hypothetical protein LEP1GSC052_0308 [Leptospira kmetyi serovar Malaysia str. Bejo-Iso9]